MSHCVSIDEQYDIKKFVLSGWSTPGLNILHDKCMKRKEKLQKIITDAGYFGPMMDVVIRGTINYVLVCYYGKETKFITSLKNGYLLLYLHEHFHTDVLIGTINKLLVDSQFLNDYEHRYRHKRSELVQSQLSFLSQNPQNIVCINISLNDMFV